MKHKERVQQIKNFTGKNKVFVIMTMIAVIFLFSGFFFSKENDVKTYETIQVETSENTKETAENPQWQFYWSDLWVLLGVGGFCTIMIIRERKKLKEELQ
ncbi:MAG: hypothetical protein NC205_06330 [Prevotella sp.]|nr:hypothetical protein [Alistipes senegalensis]MCM1358194.1 hypothetical protein [Prevotella sp.]MCM1473810.1 hypothetical protein [Muribaculaceae bacterium]